MFIYVIKSINTIVKKKLLLLSIFVLILFTNKIILSKVIIFSFEKWVKKEILVKDFNIFYKKKEILLRNVIVRDQQNLTENIFEAEEIKLDLKPGSLFTKLIIIKNIKITKPVLNLRFDISGEENNLVKDNLGISKSLENKKNPKIYPKKIVDINFLIENTHIKEFKVNITRSDNINSQTLKLSNMRFTKFGNEIGYRHYKDVYKIILSDLVMRISDQELRKIIRKHYKT